MSFLDPTAPLSTCGESSCSGCEAGRTVHCHFRPLDLVHFLTIAIPSFLVGGAAVLASGWIPLVVWIGIVLLYFSVVEIRVMCSHCPHYAEEGSTLRCWANHGSPKLWRYRPGPMSFSEKFVFLAGFAVVWGMPLPFFVLEGLWFLGAVYLLVTAGFFLTLATHLCSRCMNFACPLNRVPEPARAAFFRCNPVLAEAWEREGRGGRTEPGHASSGRQETPAVFVKVKKGE